MSQHVNHHAPANGLKELRDLLWILLRDCLNVSLRPERAFGNTHLKDEKVPGFHQDIKASELLVVGIPADNL